MKQNSIKALSIQIRLSGLSFCILNRSTNTIEWLNHVRLDKKASPFELLNELKNVVESNSLFEQTFDTITCVYQNELSCLVPKAVFNENNLADYLKFNAKILKTDFISYDELSTIQSMNVYVPLVNINNYIFDTFGSFEYKHSSTILIESLLQLGSKFSGEKLHINVNANTFEIVYVKNLELIFYNTFEYQSKEDFIYYILFTVEQLKLDPETIKTVLSGSIETTDDDYSILYKYIRFVDFIHPNYDYKFKTDINTSASHNDFILLNSFN
ncbi:DUF3822 family protein [Psychroserpens algicola]|uniref:DUF3822 family protein n=1 Tax=Psychroserpens algicola TaxID=1719034 RepID=A0ABT0HCC3_9FLAO|nr:DUF3822 family protein [Psychroserpens algicola]MCK8481492.1 DUF3822 family protein [Psychroserpens algicola]